MKEFIIYQHCKNGRQMSSESRFVAHNEMNAIAHITHLLLDSFGFRCLKSEHYMKVRDTLQTAIKENQQSVKFFPITFGLNESLYYDYVQCSIFDLSRSATEYYAVKTYEFFNIKEGKINEPCFEFITVHDTFNASAIIYNFILAYLNHRTTDNHQEVINSIPCIILQQHIEDCLKSSAKKYKERREYVPVSYVIFKIDDNFSISCQLNYSGKPREIHMITIQGMNTIDTFYHTTKTDMIKELQHTYGISSELITKKMESREFTLSHYNCPNTLSRTKCIECYAISEDTNDLYYIPLFLFQSMC